MNAISHEHGYVILACTWCPCKFEEENGEDEEKN